MHHNTERNASQATEVEITDAGLVLEWFGLHWVGFCELKRISFCEKCVFK